MTESAMTIVEVPGGKNLLDVYRKATDLDKLEFKKTLIVEGLIEAGRLYEWIGKWKGGKTLAMMDLAAHACQGLTWAGRRTIQSLWVYVAGEAVTDIEMRLAAWRLHHGITNDIPFYIRIRPVYITDEIFAQLLANEVEELKKERPGLPVVIVIDTLARNFGPGKSENNPADMGAFANNLIDIVIRPTDATGIVVHHTGHGDQERGRGHSSFEAAVDGAIKVSIDKSAGAVVRVETALSRSTEGDDSFSFNIVTQELPGKDNFDNQMEAPVLQFMDGYAPPKKSIGTGKKQRAILGLLKKLYEEHQERIDSANLKTTTRVSKAELQKEAAERKVEQDRSNFYKQVTGLKERGLIYEEAGFLYLTEESALEG